MADKVAVAIRQAEALARIEAVALALQAELGVAERELKPFGRDPALVRALQLEALADLLEDVARQITARKSALGDLTPPAQSPAAAGEGEEGRGEGVERAPVSEPVARRSRGR